MPLDNSHLEWIFAKWWRILLAAAALVLVVVVARALRAEWRF